MGGEQVRKTGLVNKVLLAFILVLTAALVASQVLAGINQSNYYYYGLPDYAGHYYLMINSEQPTRIEFLTFPGINISVEAYTEYGDKAFPTPEEFKRLRWVESRGFINTTEDTIVRLRVNPGSHGAGEYPNVIMIDGTPKKFIVGLGRTKIIEHDNLSEYTMMFFHGNSLSREYFCGPHCAHHPANPAVQELALKFTKDPDTMLNIEGLLYHQWFSQQETGLEGKPNQDAVIAKKILSNQKTISHCGRQSQLTISALRAMGLPARNAELLKLYDGNRTYPTMSHTFVQTWLPGQGWVMVDPVGVLGFVELKDFEQLYGDEMVLITYNNCTLYEKGVLRNCPEELKEMSGAHQKYFKPDFY